MSAGADAGAKTDAGNSGTAAGAGAGGEAAGSSSAAAMNAGGAGGAPAAIALDTDQQLSNLRPEFLDFLWNNLDLAHFEQWYPEAHKAFSWVHAPNVPGNLGAELNASFRSTELIDGKSHELTVTYVDRAAVAGQIMLAYAMVADVMVDGAGPFRWIVQYEPVGDDLHIEQHLDLPPSETKDAWRTHLEQRMTNLTGFLRDWFQKQYVEGELMTRGTSTITTVSGNYQLVIEQQIGKLTPEMVDWWWDNIKDTPRYHRWHPTAHQTFLWTTPPKDTADLKYDVGAVQKIVEVIGNPSTLDITWLDPSKVPVPLTYDHYVYGSTMLDGTPFGGFLLHEYTALPDTPGIKMKSTFQIPTLAGMPFAQALADHCLQEMQFLQYFVPALFAAEYHHP